MEQKTMFSRYHIEKFIIITCICMVIFAFLGMVNNLRKIVPNDSELEKIAEKNWASVGAYYVNYRLSDNDKKTVLNVQDVYFSPIYVTKDGEVYKNVVVIQERLSETRLNYFLRNGGYYRLVNHEGREIMDNLTITAVPSRGVGIDILLSIKNPDEKEVRVKYIVIGGFSGETNENKERKIYKINSGPNQPKAANG